MFGGVLLVFHAGAIAAIGLLAIAADVVLASLEGLVRTIPVRPGPIGPKRACRAWVGPGHTRATRPGRHRSPEAAPHPPGTRSAAVTTASRTVCKQGVRSADPCQNDSRHVGTSGDSRANSAWSPCS